MMTGNVNGLSGIIFLNCVYLFIIYQLTATTSEHLTGRQARTSSRWVRGRWIRCYKGEVYKPLTFVWNKNVVVLVKIKCNYYCVIEMYRQNGGKFIGISKTMCVSLLNLTLILSDWYLILH